MSDNYNNGSDNNSIKSTKKENDKHKASASRQKVIDIVNEETHHLRKERNEKKNNNNNVNSQIRRHTSTLTRPERQRPRQTIINNNNKKRPYFKKKKSDKKDKHISFIKDNYDLYKTYSCWELFALIMTFWAPNIFLKKLCRMYHPSTRQAWREKVTLCMIILFMCLLLGLLSFGLYPLLCTNNSVDNRIAYSTATPKGLEKVYRQDVVVYGGIYKFSTMKDFLSTKNVQLNNDFQGLDLSNLFDNTKGSCQSFDRFSNNTVKCRVDSPYNSFLRYKDDESCIPINDLEIYTEPDVGILAFEWEDLVPNNVNEKPLYFVYNGLVMDLTRYYSSDTKPRYLGDEMNKVLAASLGKDGTKLIISREKIRNQIKCVFQRYRAGVLSKETVGCMASQLIIIVTTLIVLVVVMIRFTMAIVFRWFIADRLTDVKKKGDGTVVLRGKHPYVAILITCYSEGRKGIKTTLDSLASASYSDRHKLFFIVADGFVKGEGNKKFTPEVCKDLLDLSPALGEPLSCSYVAIGEGEKRNNKAKVYAGYYNKDDRHIPTILVVKVGNENEAYSIKPGNRGKRDSQLILMNYFQRVLSNDRFTELDYELYWKIFFVLGTTSDTFEMVLMVDADTKVSESSMAYLVSAMKKDPSIMGCCGETKLANKSNSWVTAIQVFEYYVSHHYGKAFESVFGGVTCLPGCFSMFRLKVLKDDDCVPILSSPYIISEYQQNVVTTLHEKNLLLLGEDRYLSTLMLKNFPRRKMMFIPQATCRTTAPETLKVLMSQRRRWINSTFHNLFELLFVNDLCGIACLSMQFVVLLELIGTSVLPGAIFYTSYILINATISDKFDIFTFSLLMLLIGLPAFLSIIVTHKISNIGWMAVYLMALPLWNFMLPVYAYWHFDNFSWGETRRVSGDNSDDEEESIKNKGSFDQSKVALKSLEGWESERQRLEYCVMYHHESITYEHYNGGNTGKVNKSSGNKKSVKNRDKRNNNHHNKSESSKKKEN